MTDFRPGVLRFEFAADPDDEVRERDEGNNRKTVEIPVLAADDAGHLPDLIIARATAGPLALAAGFPRTVELRIEVQNRGAGPARLQPGVSIVSADPVVYPALAGEETIGPGEMRLYVLKVNIPAPGDYSWTIKADGEGAVRETDETNNRYVFSLKVE